MESDIQTLASIGPVGETRETTTVGRAVTSLEAAVWRLEAREGDAVHGSAAGARCQARAGNAAAACEAGFRHGFRQCQAEAWPKATVHPTSSTFTEKVAS